MKKLEITEERYQEALALYRAGKSRREAAIVVGISIEGFCEKVAKRKDAEDRGKQIRKGKLGSVINDDCLDILTPEAMYWIGFIYSDGHIDKHRPKIVVGLSEVDIAHLYKLAAFLGKGVKVNKTGDYKLGGHGYMCKPSYRVAVSSKQIHDRLKGFGFTNNKTYDIAPHDSLKHSRDFWRGVIDGDGWLYTGKSKYSWGIGVCGHYNTIVEFLAFIKANGVETKVAPTKSKKSEHLWSAELHSHVATKTAKLLYEGSNVYLDRKYEKYISWLNKK